MPTYPYCKKQCSQLLKHMRFCPLAKHSKNRPTSAQKKRKRTIHPHGSKTKLVCQRTTTKSIEASLTGDTHNAPQSIVSDQLNDIPSVRHRAHNKLISSHVPTIDTDPPHDDESFDFDPSNSFNDTSNQHQMNTSHPNNSNTQSDPDAEDLKFISQFKKFIDPDAPDPFDLQRY